ncbi:MAG: phosphate signaling complex protein PhoU [Verrucomicrobiota bacterium]
MLNSSPHILRVNSAAISALDADVRHMGALALANLRHAADGLLMRDTDLCNRAIAEDEEVDLLEKRIDHEGLEIMTRFGPVAADLRRVIASMKVSTALERISDHAVSLARRARQINQRPPLPEAAGIAALADLAAAQLRDSVAAFCEGDLAAARLIEKRDAELDAGHEEFTRRIIARLECDSAQVKSYVDLLFATRFLERIGDQSVNIAEDTVYLLTAEDIRHPVREGAE